MLPLCGGKPACFSVPLGWRMTKFQGPDLLAHLGWFSCTCLRWGGGRRAGYSSKRATARQALLLKAWKVGGGHLCSQGKDRVYWSCFLPRVSISRSSLTDCLTHCWWGLQLLGLSGSAWSCSIVCSWKVAFRLWPWFCAVCTEWGLYDGTSQGRHCTIGANNGEITLIAYSIEVGNQNQQPCHPHLPWIQKLRKKRISGP